MIDILNFTTLIREKVLVIQVVVDAKPSSSARTSWQKFLSWKAYDDDRDPLSDVSMPRLVYLQIFVAAKFVREVPNLFRGPHFWNSARLSAKLLQGLEESCSYWFRCCACGGEFLTWLSESRFQVHLNLGSLMLVDITQMLAQSMGYMGASGPFFSEIHLKMP